MPFVKSSKQACGLIFSLLERFSKGKQDEKSTRFLSKTGAFGRG
jgi:hypothetical protein